MIAKRERRMKVFAEAENTFEKLARDCMRTGSTIRPRNTLRLPAGQVHGEGIFIQFNEDALQKWEKLTPVKSLDDQLKDGHGGWRNARKLDPDEGYSHQLEGREGTSYQCQYKP